MRRSGLEWLFRLLQEPRRLWRRYFTIVPQFIILALGQLLKAWMTSRSESNWNWSKVRKLIRNRVTSL